MDTENKQAAEEKTTPEQPVQPVKKPRRSGKDEKIAELTDQLEQQKDAFLRVAAEFDNFKKRTAREKDGIYSEAVAATVNRLLPVLDCLERAAEAEGDAEAIKKGIEMTLKQFETAFEAMGVAEIEAKPGCALDPNLHNAMMHGENPDLPESCIEAVLAKGYKIGERVIRYTMVKAAN